MDAIQQSATVGAAAGNVLGGNIHRRRLTISPPSAGRVTIQFGGTAVLDQGVTVQTGTQPLHLDISDMGDLIRQPVSAIADAAGRVLSLIEYIHAGP